MSDWMKDGDDPSFGYCRICGEWKKPTYEGHYQHGVCSMTCYDEWKWRETLHILRKPYRARVQANVETM